MDVRMMDFRVDAGGNGPWMVNLWCARCRKMCCDGVIV